MNTYTKDPSTPARACLIWMHGLGSDAQNMMSLANVLQSSYPLRHVFIEASIRPITLNNHMPMRAWYDLIGLGTTSSIREDRVGVLESEEMIRQVIVAEHQAGFAFEQIYLVGFSQGGAMALYTGLKTPGTIGGIIGLSCYMPLAGECQAILKKDTPIFMASGQYDDIITPDMVHHSEVWLEAQGYTSLTSKDYPMAHEVCQNEIIDMVSWLEQQILIHESKGGVVL